MSNSVQSKRPNTTTLSPLADRTDEDLLSAYRKNGDREAFNQLVRRYERELYNYLRRYLGNAAQAEDAFQSTFLLVHLKCAQFDESRKVKPWLYTIATNQAIDLQRRNKRHRMVTLDRRHSSGSEDDLGSLLDLLQTRETNPLAQLESAEQQAWVRRALENLPEYLRTSVNLIFHQGLKYREAADILEVPVGTVKSRLHTAILKLNQAWQADHPADDMEDSHEARPSDGNSDNENSDNENSDNVNSDDSIPSDGASHDGAANENEI